MSAQHRCQRCCSADDQRTDLRIKLDCVHGQGAPGVYIDPCLAQIVQALNDAGIPTRSSCCGHGKVVGCIALEDGRDLLIMTREELLEFMDAVARMRPGVA